MGTIVAPRPVMLAEHLYRLALRVYPADFRCAYAEEMAYTFHDACYEIFAQEGYAGVARFFVLTFFDLLFTSCKEHVHVQRDVRWGMQDLSGLLYLEMAQGTDRGIVRSLNEDQLLAVLPDDPQVQREKGMLFVVADGLGGQTQGERASELAVTTIREVYYQVAERESGLALRQAVEEANRRIYIANVALKQEDTEKSMATTCVVAVLQGHELVVANVGDSRAYVIHKGEMRQVSRDHSLVADMVRAGEITAEEARQHEQRNKIYRSLGYQPVEEVDLFSESVEDGDLLLLCTDGLYNLIRDEEMLNIILGAGVQQSVARLIACANQAGGTDNITAIVVRVDTQS